MQGYHWEKIDVGHYWDLKGSGKWLFASRKTKINPVADPEGGEKIKIKIKINEIWTKVFYHLTQETNASKLGTARSEYHVS